ncbi:MAG: PEP-CTERM sorting domain-containing protein [Planctomycetota bacterium]
MNLRLANSIRALAATAAAFAVTTAPALELVQSFADEFSDADRNNDGIVDVYDTDINLSDTLNQSPEDDQLNNDRNLIELTGPEPGATPQSGLVWLATRGFTSSNTGDPKNNLKVFDDSVGRTDNEAGVTETNAQVFGSGYALGAESKGTGSSFIGVFPEAVSVGPNAGDKVVVSLDWRFWRLSNNPASAPGSGQLRWGLWQDTDGELGQTGPGGRNGDPAVWGAEDGDWRTDDSDVGAEGDRGIYTRLPLGPSSDPESARINWEYNLRGINGTSNNGRFFEGSGVSNDPGAGGDVGTVASPTNDGPGGSVAALGSHELAMELVRLDDGLIEVASFIDGVEILRDEIKTTDTGFGVIGPPADTFHYVGFRNSTGDYDYAIDNFLIQSFAIPEPTSAALLAIAAGGLAFRRRCKG